jgi:hypothetical protein
MAQENSSRPNLTDEPFLIFNFNLLYIYHFRKYNFIEKVMGEKFINNY